MSSDEYEPLLLLATARSGSTVVCRALAAYLKARYGVQELGEAFGLWSCSLWDTGT
jgi:hypothetical protein